MIEEYLDKFQYLGMDIPLHDARIEEVSPSKVGNKLVVGEDGQIQAEDVVEIAITGFDEPVLGENYFVSSRYDGDLDDSAILLTTHLSVSKDDIFKLLRDGKKIRIVCHEFEINHPEFDHAAHIPQIIFNPSSLICTYTQDAFSDSFYIGSFQCTPIEQLEGDSDNYFNTVAVFINYYNEYEESFQIGVYVRYVMHQPQPVRCVCGSIDIDSKQVTSMNHTVKEIYDYCGGAIAHHGTEHSYNWHDFYAHVGCEGEISSIHTTGHLRIGLLEAVSDEKYVVMFHGIIADTNSIISGENFDPLYVVLTGVYTATDENETWQVKTYKLTES